MQYAEAVIRVAESFIGVTEKGGANRGPYVDAFARDIGREPGGAWCAYFVCAVRKRAAEMMRGACANAVSGSAVGCYQKAPAEFRVEPADLQPGDQFCRTRDPLDAKAAKLGKQVLGHTGIVVRVVAQLAKGVWLFETIEGNTLEDKEDDTGGGVWRKSTLRSDDPRLLGGVRPAMVKP